MASKSNTFSKVTNRRRPRINTTLFDLVRAINSVTENDRDVVATAAHLVNFNRTRLAGSLKNGRVVIE